MAPGMLWQILVGSFGVAAALLLLGGWVLLRFQRDRQHFQLMQSALERGITALPGLVPGWLLSLRQGVLALVLGIGVAVAGYLLLGFSYHVDEAPADAVTTRMATQDMHRPFPPPPPPDQDGWDQRSPHGGGPGGPPPPPPRPSPAMERWHHIQTQRTAGIVILCAGGILALLGLVRIAFAALERKYATAALNAKNPA